MFAVISQLRLRSFCTLTHFHGGPLAPNQLACEFDFALTGSVCQYECFFL